MSKGSNNTPRTRKAKVLDGESKQIKEKFLEQREDKINTQPIKPWNGKQKYYMDLINDPDIPTILCTGYAGSSKTFLPTSLAADALRLGKIKKIIFSRPNISNSKSLGYFAGSLVEKISHWLLPVLDILNDRLGKNLVELYIKNGDIQFIPLETIKGYSANDCIFIIDEAEDLTKDEAKKVITRQGEGCKMILCGDVSQSELKEGSGLKYLIDISKKYDNLVLGLVDFNEVGDIVRSHSVKQWIVAFNKEENK